MSEMNVPPDPFSVNNHTVVPPTAPQSQVQAEHSPVPVKDSVEAISNRGNTSFTQGSDAPQLKTPDKGEISFIAYLEAMGKAKLNHRLQLRASDLVDQESRSHSSLGAAAQAEYLVRLYEQRSQALAQLEAEAKQALDEIQKKLEEMQAEMQEQQNRIDQMNAGNALEKQKYAELTKAYDDYIKNLKSIGAVDQGNGNYLIPEGAQDQYNAFTQQYQKAVDNFNGYWKERQGEIKEYNSATIAYNQTVAANNAYLNDLINKYGLSNFLKDQGITIPNQTGADLRDLSGFLNEIVAPSSLTKTPSVVTLYPFPNYARSIAHSGPPSLPKLADYPTIDGTILYEGIYQNLYDAKITALDQQISSNFAYWAFLHTQELFHPLQASIPDPLLNTKNLTQKILPDAYLQPPKPVTTSGTSLLSLRDIGVDNSHVEEILGRSLFKQALQKIAEEKGVKFTEEKIDQMTQKLLFLSVGLLGNQSLQALFPSLSPISSSLSSLPQDSPIFAILFTVSLANRIQEDATQGITPKALQSFMNHIPELNTLTDAERENLVAILNLGQLLVAGKLLESNLGLPGLLAQLLSTASPAIDSTTLLSQAAQEGRTSLSELQTGLESHFIKQGDPEDKAKLLAQVGTQLVEHGLLTPTATAITASQPINHPLLVDSIKAALVLANYPLNQAHTLASEAVNRTLIEAPYHSIKQFRTALKSHLQDIGVHDKSAEIALQAIVIPSTDPSLPFLASSPLKPQLSQAELITTLEKRALQLLTPQLGTKLAKEVTQEIAQSLFGNPPDSRETEVKSPYSLTNAIKDQLYHLHIEQNQEWATAVSQTFKESIKTMHDFYAFSLKVMDPAYLFIYSAHAGIIYGDQGMIKPIKS